MSISNNKTSHLISTQLPAFIREDHGTFVEFLEAYYKFLEQSGQAINEAKNFLRNKDVDLADDVYLQKLYDNFISLIPKNVLADKTFILKHVKDFYRARGSEKSVRFLLRILLNKEIEFYYPKRDILRASDGKWYIEKSVKVSDISVNNVANSIAYPNFINKTIRGNTSNATALVESVDVYYDVGQLVTEIKLSNEYRTFDDGETIFAYYREEGEDKFLSATLFSGVITGVTLVDGGSGYNEGDHIPIEGGGGTGAQIVISSVTKGSLSTIGIERAGAGFQANDQLLITGGSGTGAAANVYTVDMSGNVHPNTYNIVASQIYLEANTPIGNAVYSNLNGTDANSWIANAVSTWLYANCGPILTCLVINGGNNYSIVPSMDVISNTVIRSLGVLGRLEIINGGLNYEVGDVLEFINPLGSYGSGASANVTSVAANGAITDVEFVSIPGFFPGGFFYDQSNLPTVNVSSNTGSGANIMATAILGDGESLVASSTTIGKILKLTILSGGSGFTSVPTLNLANMSSGSNGIATATIVTGSYQYPGRYLNDDGHLSSFNFLEDRDYYQLYSYVVRVNEPLNKYKKAIKNLTHPAGTKLFGEYIADSSNTTNIIANTVSYVSNATFMLSEYFINTADATKNGVYNVSSILATYSPEIFSGSYSISSNINNAVYDTKSTDIIINTPSHGFRKNDSVYLMFFTNYANITNGLYTVSSANTNYFVVPVVDGNSSFVQLPDNLSNLTVSTGTGNSNSYITLSEWIANSNVTLTTGDSINVSGNVVMVVYSVPNSNAAIVSPALTGNLIANSFFVSKARFGAYGNVRIYNPVITIGAQSTGLMAGENTYLKFLSSDASLSNGLYSVLSGNSSYIKVSHKDVVNSTSLSGNVNVYTKTINITSANNGIANDDVVHLIFSSGDLANVTNSQYTARNVTNTGFEILSANIATSEGNVTIKSANVTVQVTDHGFESNDSVYIWYRSGDTANLTNGYQEITVYDANNFGFETTSIPSSNGDVSVYRGYMNVTINSAFSIGNSNTVGMFFETGDLANISNGVYIINSRSLYYPNSYNILHDNITITGNLANLVISNSGTVYATFEIGADIVSFDASAQAIFDAFTIEPLYSEKVSINTLVVALKAANIWDELDILYVLAAANEQAARINWKNPGSYTATAVNSPTFTAFEGFTGDGATAYLNTNWTPSTNGVNFTQNSASVWAHTLTNIASNVPIVGGVVGRYCFLYTRTVAGNLAAVYLNGPVGGASITVGTSAGFLGGQRRANNDVRLFKNGVQVAANAQISTGVAATNMWMLGVAPSGGYSPHQLAFAAWGGALEGKEADFYNSIQDYLVTVGAV